MKLQGHVVIIIATTQSPWERRTDIWLDLTNFKGQGCGFLLTPRKSFSSKTSSDLGRILGESPDGRKLTVSWRRTPTKYSCLPENIQLLPRSNGKKKSYDGILRRAQYQEEVLSWEPRLYTTFLTFLCIDKKFYINTMSDYWTLQC